MFLSRIYTIFVLVFIGSQRSNASPPDRFQLGAESMKPLFHLLDGEEKEGPITQLTVESCRTESKDFQEQLSKMVSDADELMEKQENLISEETILVLGNVGAGKTSLVQLLTGNADLQSRKLGAGNDPTYVFEDGKRIGTSNSGSFTLFPEIASFNTTINFVDTPGFQDTTQPAHEVASSIIMKTITKKLKKAKFLLLVDFDTLQQRDTEEGFINALRNLYSYLSFDFDKYKDQIALIVTKVPVTPKSDDSEETCKAVMNGILEEQASIIDNFMEYFNKLQAYLGVKLEQKMIENHEREFYQNVIRLLKSLQTRSEGGEPLRINVFRSPNKPGPLEDNELMQWNRLSLLGTVEKLNSFDVDEIDFRSVLSNEANIFLKCQLVLLSNHYKNRVNDVVSFVEGYASDMNYTTYFSTETNSDIQSMCSKSEQFMQNIGQLKNYYEFSKAFNATELAIWSKRRLETRERIIFNFLEKYGEIIKLGFVDTSGIFKPSSWTARIKHSIDLMKKEEKWCNTLIKFIDGLSSYKMQKRRNEIYDEIYSVKSKSAKKYRLISMFLNVTGSRSSELFGKSHFISRRQKSEIELIARNMLKKKYTVQSRKGCGKSYQDELYVEGFTVCLSHIISDDFLESCCKNKSVSKLYVYAVDKVFIDIPKWRLEGINLFIAAQYWEVIGERTDIELVGRAGQRESELFGLHLENDKDGKPGLPGGVGGSFFGFGMNFVNCENLHVMSVGGKGGPGIDGANGKPGKDGKSGYEKAVEVLRAEGASNDLVHGITEAHDSIEMTESILRDNGLKSRNISVNKDKDDASCQNKSGEVLLNSYKFDGDCGEKGLQGGYGGKGGFGGLGGVFKVVEAGDHRSNINFLSKNGENGEDGRRGQSGEQGKDGIGLACYKKTITEQDQAANGTKSYWKCCETYSKCNDYLKQEVKSGSDYHIDTEIERPSRKTLFRLFYFGLRSYSLFLRDLMDSKDLISYKAIKDFEKFFLEKHDISYLNIDNYFSYKSYKKWDDIDVTIFSKLTREEEKSLGI